MLVVKKNELPPVTDWSAIQMVIQTVTLLPVGIVIRTAKQNVIPGPAPDFAVAQPAAKTAVPDPAVAWNPMTACRHPVGRPAPLPAR
jgi:hypothetical protein